MARSEPLANGLTLLTLEVEVSRDKVPIRNGYRHVGQRARIRVNGGVEHELVGARGGPCAAQTPFQDRYDSSSCYMYMPTGMSFHSCHAIKRLLAHNAAGEMFAQCLG